MSSGHNRTSLGDTVNLEKLETPEVRERLRRAVSVNNAYDVPYLGGYSKDGNTIYFDRHLPAKIVVMVGHKSVVLDPRTFIELHERFEKALMDLHGMQYAGAHRAANAYEHRHLTLRFGPQAWRPYMNELRPYIKAMEHEKIKQVPPDLDMAPYYAPPTNERLIAVMRKSQGKPDKVSKASVQYVSLGHGAARCAGCVMFEKPRACDQVVGVIDARGWCKLWERK